MRLESLKARLSRLLEAQGPPDGPPSCILFLPGKDGRGPDLDADLPLPRIQWRSAKAVCIFYDPDVGQPSSEDVARLLADEGVTP